MTLSIDNIQENNNYKAINIGSLDSLSKHKLVHPKTGETIEGKLFLKDLTEATGTEISFNTLPQKTELPYFHIHNQNEETYIILKGSREFQVDDDCFPIYEGSIVRIAPSGVRGLRNTSKEPMIYIVIQSKKNSLLQYSTQDGKRIDKSDAWQ